MSRRDLFLGAFLLLGAGWLGTSFPREALDPLTAFAILCCGLAGTAYMVAGFDLGIDSEVAGRVLTRLRFRAIAQGLLACSLIGLGAGGLLLDGDLVSGAIGVVGVAVLLLARRLWQRGAPE